jgi:RNA polymerase sigma factor (sigma-70 family)
MRGKGTPYYGKLMTDSLPSEVKAIWYSRDAELPELPKHGWSWELQTDIEAIEKHDLVVKLLEAIPLTEREDLVVRLVVLENETFRDVGDQLDCTTERARQIYMKAIRKLRTKQAAVTGIAIWPYECEINTWRGWKHFEKNRP